MRRCRVVTSKPLCVQDVNVKGVLDLRRCTSVEADEGLAHEYGIRVVFPERTFYFCANSDLDRAQWLDALHWHLVGACRS